jgi:hypothetical protein
VHDNGGWQVAGGVASIVAIQPPLTLDHHPSSLSSSSSSSFPFTSSFTCNQTTTNEQKVQAERSPDDDDDDPLKHNPHHNAFFASSTLLKSELQAKRSANPFRSRHWRVESVPVSVSVGRDYDEDDDQEGASGGGGGSAGAADGARRVEVEGLNRTGHPTAYSLHSGSGVVEVMASEKASFLRRAGFLLHHLWVTAFAPEEKYPG